jgi:hypothetical protein
MTPQAGSAARWGPLWGARPDGWAASEEQQTPTYEEAIRHVGIAAGQRVLEVACGTGVFLRLAADRGALAAYRTADGGYRLHNEFLYLVAAAA